MRICFAARSAALLLAIVAPAAATEAADGLGSSHASYGLAPLADASRDGGFVVRVQPGVLAGEAVPAIILEFSVGASGPGTLKVAPHDHHRRSAVVLTLDEGTSRDLVALVHSQVRAYQIAVANMKPAPPPSLLRYCLEEPGEHSGYEISIAENGEAVSLPKPAPCEPMNFAWTVPDRLVDLVRTRVACGHLGAPREPELNLLLDCTR